MFACLGFGGKGPLVPQDSLPTTYTPNIQYDSQFHDQFKRQYAEIYNLLCLGRRLEAIPLVQAALKGTGDDFPLEYAWFLVLRCFLDFDGAFLKPPPEVEYRRREGLGAMESEIVTVATYPYMLENGLMITFWNHREWKGKEKPRWDGERARSVLDLLHKLATEYPIPFGDGAKDAIVTDLVLLFHIMNISHLVAGQLWQGLSASDKELRASRLEDWESYWTDFRQYSTCHRRLDLLQLLGNLAWSHMEPLDWVVGRQLYFAKYCLKTDGEAKARQMAKSQNETAVAQLHKRVHRVWCYSNGDRVEMTSRAHYLELAQDFARLGNTTAHLQSCLYAVTTGKANKATWEQKLRELSVIRQKSLALDQPRLTLTICSAEVNQIFNKNSLREGWRALLPILKAIDDTERSRVGASKHVCESSPTWIHRIIRSWMQTVERHPPHDRVLMAMIAERFAWKYHPPLQFHAEYMTPLIVGAYTSAFESLELYRGDLGDATGLRTLTGKLEEAVSVLEAAGLESHELCIQYAERFTRLKISEAVCDTNIGVRSNYLRRAAEVGHKYYALALTHGDSPLDETYKNYAMYLGGSLLCIEAFDPSALGARCDSAEVLDRLTKEGHYKNPQARMLSMTGHYSDMSLPLVVRQDSVGKAKRVLAFMQWKGEVWDELLKL